MPVPQNWGSGESAAVRDAAVDGKIEHVIIKARGSGYQRLEVVLLQQLLEFLFLEMEAEQRLLFKFLEGKFPPL